MARDQRAMSTVLDLLRPDIRAMHGYVPGEQVRDAIKLNTNESAVGPSPMVMEALAEIAADTLRLYPDPVSRRLRETAASLFGVTAEEILAGNGSDDCLTIVYRAFLAPGDRVVCPWPTYGLYDTLATLQGARLAPSPYRQVGRRWELPDALLDPAAKMVILANPNNPSATLVPAADVRRICDRAPGIVVVDEAYVDFALGAGEDASMLPYLREHPNVIVLRTFSKSYSLAGARLGLLFAAAPIIRELEKVKDSYNVDAVAQAVGTAALLDRAHHELIVRRTLEERRRLEHELPEFGFTWPESGANFLLCEVPGVGEAERVYRALKARGVLVRWWNTPELKNRLRITVGAPEHNDALLAGLRAVAAQGSR